MILSVQQPQYISWLGFFNKIDRSDLFVSFDSVQFVTHGFIYRNKIKTPQGWTWLTIPVKHKHGCRINEVRINNGIDWVERHLRSLKHSYSKAPFFNEYFGEIEEIYRGGWDMLSDFNDTLLKWLLEKLGIGVKFFNLSDLGVEGMSTLRIVNLCKKLGADTYLSGPGGKDYVIDEMFKKDRIRLIYQDFKHPVYTQRFGEFMPGLSVVDLLFNHGDKSLGIIRSGGK
jgi:hypothetical protein